MEAVNFFLRYGIMAFVFVLASCSDGEDGAIGPQGIAGSEGATGSQGASGPQGIQGVQGIQGEQGNANARTFTFDASTESGISMNLAIPELTQAVLDTDAILWYLNTNGFSYSIPGAVDAADYVTRVYALANMAFINFHNWDGTAYTISAGDIDEIKMIIIGSTATTTKTAMTALEELTAAGVDINDYDAVVAYYTE